MKNYILFILSMLVFTGSFNASAQSVEFKVERLTDDTYQVVMKPSVTWTAPNNNTLGLQVTLLAPTSSLQISNLTDINGVWTALPTIVAPTENPTKDYFVFYMPSSAQLPYTAGVETRLFTFKRVGVCTGTVELINNTTDPFMPPNSRSLNVGNNVTTSGGGGSGNNLWTANFGTTATCPRDCQIEYKLIALSTGKYQVSMIPKVNLSGVLATTATQQVTIRVPTGGFVATNVTNLVGGAAYAQTSRYDAPTENTSKDYLVFTLQNLGTTTLSYAANVEVPLFTFDNTGACGTGLVELMNNATDPYKSPNSAASNVGQQITTIGGGIDMPICLNTAYSAACAVVPVTCQIEYKLIPLSTGKYQVSMIPKTTWAGALATTATQQVTIRVPTGGFVATNVTNLVGGAAYAQTSRYDAPTENTSSDYLIFTLQNLGTTTLSYATNVEVPLFTFDNTGACGTGLVELMNNTTDPFKKPNGRAANVGQQLTTIGGGVDVPICLNTAYSAACAVVPVVCQIEYKLIPLSTGKYQVSMIPKTTWAGALATTATQQVTIRVPTGGFVASNLMNLVGGAAYAQTSRYNAPTENTGSDYLVFTLQNLGTTTLSYAANVEVPLFTFTNTGSCGVGNVELMNNTTDPFKKPNGSAANVGQQLTTVGGGVDVPICLNTDYSAACAVVPVVCQVEYKLILLSAGKYRVSMIPKVDWSGSLATTATQQVTIVAPTGGFIPTNVVNLVGGVTYLQTSRFNAPTESASKDYVVFTLQNLGTSNLTYVANVEVPLFTFDNVGSCSAGGSNLIALMDNYTDNFRKPNSSSANVGQQLTTVGGGVDVPICIAAGSPTPCTVLPVTCQIEYRLIPLSRGKYQVSMLPNTTGAGALATTATQQVTIVVPIGGFVAANVTNLVGGAAYAQTSRYNAPTENTGSDYLVFTLQNLGTTTLPYAANVEVPLFTFDNGGLCGTGNVRLMNNTTDPFKKPNGSAANVGQQLTTIGGGVDVPICLHTDFSAACTVTCPNPVCLPVIVTRQ